jgi:hypothetical protein
MTDSFLSGWGAAKGKKSKLVFECDSLDEARLLRLNALDRSDMAYVYIKTKKPYYSPRTHHVEVLNKETAPRWYKPGAFKGGEE